MKLRTHGTSYARLYQATPMGVRRNRSMTAKALVFLFALGGTVDQDTLMFPYHTSAYLFLRS